MKLAGYPPSFVPEALMTLINSLNIAVNGLSAQSYAIANSSNNLANASTTAYKSSTTSFDDIVVACDAESTSYSGKCGVLPSTTNHNDKQGIISASLTGTNLAINGNGYFAVETATVTAADTATGIELTTTFNPDIYYTRAGDFSMNASGYLENRNNFYLMGYAVDPATGAVGTSLVPVNISSTAVNETVPSTVLSYLANLNASAAVGTTSSLSPVAIYASDYDSALNNTHNVSYAWEKTGTNAWTLTVSALGGAFGSVGGDDFSASIPVTFDTSGNIDTVSAGSGYTVAGSTISYTLNYNGADPQMITCDLSEITQYASPTGLTADVASFSQNGVPEGSYSGIEIDSNGNLAINYSNGISTVVYEIALATFVNTSDLEAMSGNAYKSTIASGDATYTTAGVGGAGIINASSLESSNVDIADEFTTMIQTQQVYSANAKVVSAVNSMMQTLIQMQSA